MSKDDGIDEHGMELVGSMDVIVLQSWANHSQFLLSPDHKSDPA
jgi:hypothetical protein